MASPNVTTNLTSISTCEAITGFTALGGGASGLTQETDFLIQGSFCVSKQISVSGTLKGMWYDNAAGIDLSGGNHAWVWIYMSTNQLIATKPGGGLRVRIGGNPNTNFKEWFAYGSNDYIEGGWKRVPIDATSTADVSGGTLTTSACQWFGAQAAVIGTAKSTNLGIDTMHYGTGHRLSEGDSSTPGSFDTITGFDDTSAARYGVFSKRNGVYNLLGRLTVGPITGSNFSRMDQTVATCFFVEPPVPVQSTLMGWTVTGSNTTVNWTNVNLQSLSSTYLGDFIVASGSTVTITNGSWSGIRVVTMGNNASFIGTKISTSGLITQNNGTLTNVIVDRATGAVAVLSNDPSKISGCEFISDGTGHAIEISVAGTYTFTGNVFTSYAAVDGSTGNEAIYNNSGGAVTLNIAGGGSTPSIRNGAGASTTVNNNKSVTLTGLKDNTEVRVYSAGTVTELAGTEDATTGTSDNRSFTFALAAGTNIDIRIHKVTYEHMDILGFVVPSNDSSIPVSQRFDRNYSNL